MVLKQQQIITKLGGKGIKRTKMQSMKQCSLDGSFAKLCTGDDLI